MNDTDKEVIRQEVIKEQEEREIKYMVDGKEVTLSIPIIRKFIVPDSPQITNAECMRFLKRCQARQLNPFIGDVDLVKYGTFEASTIVKKDYFMKQARKHPDFEGMQAGIIIKNKEGIIEEREGAVTYDGETLLGGWCRAYRKTDKFPSVQKPALKEFIGRKKDGSANRLWAKMPATMIRKVAAAQALREAFPNLFNGLYDESEINKLKNENNSANNTDSNLPNPGASQIENIKNMLSEDEPAQEVEQTDEVKEALKQQDMI